jgi:hypothetical protein
VPGFFPTLRNGRFFPRSDFEGPPAEGVGIKESPAEGVGLMHACKRGGDALQMSWGVTPREVSCLY